MAYEQLKAAIAAAIYENQTGDITGEALQLVLFAIVDSLGEGYQFAGLATPSTQPGMPDKKVFYIAGPGTYTNFDTPFVEGVTVKTGEIGIFTWGSGPQWDFVAVITGPSIVDNLNDGGSTKALSAEMGKVLAQGYKYYGIASPETDPGTPDQNVFYIASKKGTYANFGGIVVSDGEVAALCYNGTWQKHVTGSATVEQVNQLSQKVDKIYSDKSGKFIPDVYTFPGSAGYLSFNPITISKEGDSIEIELLTSLTADDAVKGMAFCFNGSSRGICLTRNTIGIMTLAGSWLDGMDSRHGQYNFTTGDSESLATRGKVKIALEQGALNVYINNTLCKSISSFSETIQVDCIGKPYIDSNYWSGTIYSFKYTHNGVTKELYDLPGYSESNKGAISYTTRELPSGVLQDTIEALEEAKVDIYRIDETAFEYMIEEKAYPVSSIPGRTKLSNHVSFPDTNAEVFTSNSEYDSYFFYADGDFDCWLIDPGLSYLAISIGTSAGQYDESTHQIPCSSTTRYRKSNNNLPTESSPLSVSPGDVVVIDVPAGKSVAFVKKYNGVKFNGETPLSNKHIEQVISSSKPYFNYVEGLLEIMIPSNDGFVKYAFVHSVNVSRNCDVWRVDYAAKCDSSGLETQRITTDGEWEIAIHLKDRTDFSGGLAHGDEIYSSILFFADGQVIDITNPASGSFSELRILETSTLYDPNDSVTPIATHTSEHIFNLNGLVINQTLEWLVDALLTESYMAMFPVAQAVTDTYCSDNDFSPVSLPSGGANQINIYGANQVEIWSDDANVFCVFSVGKYNGLQGSQLHFLMHNNGSTLYNKCYFFVSKAGDTATAGDLWKTQTIYKIMAKNDN